MSADQYGSMFSADAVKSVSFLAGNIVDGVTWCDKEYWEGDGGAGGTTGYYWTQAIAQEMGYDNTTGTGPAGTYSSLTVRLNSMGGIGGSGYLPRDGSLPMTGHLETGAYYVRIGATSDPLYHLHVEADRAAQPLLFVQNDSTTGNGAYISGGDTSSHYALWVQDYAQAITGLYVDGAGSVAINSTTPDAKLHIVGSSAASGAAYTSGAQLIIEDGGANQYIQFSAETGATSLSGLMFGDDDSDVGYLLYAHSNNSFAIAVNAGIRFGISSAGAITFNSAYTFPASDGTTNYFLQTDGAGTLTWASASAGGVDGSGTANYIPKWSDSDTLTNSVMYDNGTSVGLGTASPASQDSTRVLEISGTGFPALQFTKTDAGTANTIGTIAFSRTNSDALAKIGATTDGATDSAYIFFQTQNAGGNITERMRLDSTGNFSIGTISTDTPLRVENASAGDKILHLTNKGAATFAVTPTGTVWDFDAQNSGGQIAFSINESEAMRINGSGHLGIGVTPSYNFHLEDDVSNFLGYMKQNNTGNHVLDIESAGTSGNILLRGHSSSTTRFQLNDNGVAYFQGNVGIGTTSPADMVHIVGADGATARTSWQNATQVIIENAGAAYLHFSTGNSDHAGLTFDDEAGVQRGWVYYDHGTTFGTTADALIFGTGSTTRMVIDSGGDVGIGTSTPLNTVDINSCMGLRPSGANDISILFAAYHNGASWAHQSASVAAKISTYSTGLRFSVTPSGSDGSTFSWVDAVSIDTAGRVGIGTTSPSSTLHVYDTSSGSTAGIRVENNSGTDWGMGELVFNNTFSIYDFGASDGRLNITNSGQCGIGTQTPASRLHVASSTTFSAGSVCQLENSNSSTTSALNVLYAGYSNAAPNNTSHRFQIWVDSSAIRATMYSNGDWENQNNAYGGPSDSRLKRDIQTARDYWEDFQLLKFCKYRWVQDGEGGARYFGVVAQELQKVFPSCVYSGTDGMLSVKYSVLQTIGMKVTQEIQYRVETLTSNYHTLDTRIGVLEEVGMGRVAVNETKIAELETKVADLEARISVLEAA